MLERCEEPGLGERRAPVTQRVVGAFRIDRIDDPIEGRDPGSAAVSLVPDESEPAARPQHPVELGERTRPVEPMERLGHGDRVERSITEGHRFRRSIERHRAGRRHRDAVAHACERLHGDDGRSGRDERAGELAGPRADIRDGGP